MFRVRISHYPLVLVFSAAFTSYAQDIIQPGDSHRGSGTNRPAARPNGYIVQFVKGTSRGARALVAAQAGAAIRYNYASTDAIAVTVPNASALNSLKGNATVTSSAPDYVV